MMFMTKKAQSANIQQSAQQNEALPLKPKGHLAKQRAKQQGQKGRVNADAVLLENKYQPTIINITDPHIILIVSRG